MEPVEIKLGLLERSRLHAISARIYNRLILESPRFNAEADQLQNVLLGLGGVAVIGIIAFATRPLVSLANQALAEAEWCPEFIISILNFAEAESWAPAVLVAVLLIVFFLRGISAAFFEGSGGFLILQRKLGADKQRKTELLDIVETWLRRQPEKICDAHELLYKKPAHALLPVKVSRALRRHSGSLEMTASDDIGPPVLIIRHFAEKKYFPLYLLSGLNTPAEYTYGDDPTYFRNARGYRNAIRINLVFDVLGAELRDEIPSGANWRRNYFTGLQNQYTSLSDPYDIHLRFRMASPHYRWPNNSRPSSERETATFRAIMSLENPMRAPFYVTAVADIIKAFPRAVAELYQDCAGDSEEAEKAREERVDSALSNLQIKDIPMYGKRDPATLRTTADGGTVPEPVLRNANKGKTGPDGETPAPDWMLKWDPNIIDWSQIVDPGGEIFRSLAILVRAIDIASRDAKRVELGRGDVAIIDNLRCLVGRREWVGEFSWLKQVLGFPERWWMRGYYGFRKSDRPKDILGS